MTTTTIAPYQNARGTTSEWSTANPVLREGLLGWDITLKRGKIGDGVTTWNLLPYTLFQDPWTSPALLGNPTAPTPAFGDNDTSIATSAFVQAAVLAGSAFTLITPTSIANSGGSASLSGGAVAATGVTSVSVNGVFSALYDNYVIEVNGLTSGANPFVDLKLRLAGTDSAVTYYWSSIANAYTSSGVFASDSNTTSWRVGEVTTSASGGLVVNLFQPFLAVRSAFHSDYAASTSIGSMGGYHDAATSYDGFTLSVATSTLTATAIRTYGLKK